MKYQWRITKYNPIFRNDAGHYLLNEWTCPSEIGNVIDGELFTLEQYLIIEHAYVETLIAFLNEKRQYFLRVIQAKKRSVSHEEKTSLLYDHEFDEINIKEDKIVNINEIRIICKMILRNLADCQFFSSDNFFVHFGWDFYMYIGSSQKSEAGIEFAIKNGLFVEQMDSPYHFEEKDVTRLVQWNKIDDETKVVVGSELLLNVPISEYRNVFHLSLEHPMYGSFEITEAHKNFFQKLIAHKMDFSKYEYEFFGGH
ncbi:hypothetical protein A8709_17700 [Paenibacillus pectinilyticus]|uniref:DUF7683 domain-containing protein n=1 Tax=Paenibacillus pectinilyticus TaxID=512399 RepID=A0A1C0ZZH6_9BACL|nr:hypothetical protein [Paenibacillus pectinilyticus]OCT13441.1 hypothetical protein A8709_17700 [Paenibacillus pectinilyticus]